jgi:hypothetical protein
MKQNKRDQAMQVLNAHLRQSTQQAVSIDPKKKKKKQ